MIYVAAIVITLGMGMAISNIARAKGYQPLPWFVYGALIWPVALIHVWLLKSRTKEVVAAAIAAVEARHCEFSGALVGPDGTSEQRAVLTMKGFSWILTTDSGGRWEEQLQGVQGVVRPDGLLELTLGANNWLFRADDQSKLVGEGSAMGVELSRPAGI